MAFLAGLTQGTDQRHAQIATRLRVNSGVYRFVRNPSGRIVGEHALQPA